MMKLRNTITVCIIIWITGWDAWAGTSLLTSFEWPLSPPSLFLKGGVNAVTAGSDLVFWALGDTIEVIDKNSFSHLSTIHVETSTAIQDILYDDVTDTLFVAAGYDNSEHRGGLQIFNVSDPLIPTLTVVYDESDNPGSYRKSDTEVVAVPDIDARGLGLYGNTLFLADDNFGLRVIDVTDKSQPSEIPLTTTTENRASGYKQPNISGDYGSTGGYVNLFLYPYDEKVYAFVLDFYHGVKVFDVTDPKVINDPVLKDTRTYFWYGSLSLLSDIFVNETGGRLTAFVTGGNSTGSAYAVSRLDVSFDEDSPITNFGRCITTGEARSVCAKDDYAYIADGVSGLAIVDIAAVPETNTESVLTYKIVGSYSSGVDLSYNVFLDGTVLYLASGESGLNKFDVSQPKNPVYIGKMNSPVSGNDVCVSGDYTYVLDRQNGLRIFDSSEPSYLLLKSYIKYVGPSMDLAVSANYAYIANSNGYISIVDVKDPLAPVLTGLTVPVVNPQKLFISEKILYVVTGDGLKLVDISNPLNPVSISSVSMSGNESVYVYDGKAYIARGENGISILDVSVPQNPNLLASTDTINAKDVAVTVLAGTVYLLVADGEAGLKIFNASGMSGELSEPITVTMMDSDTETPSAFTALSVSSLDSQVFVGLGKDGVLVLDCSNPLAPLEIDHKTSSASSGDIVAQAIDSTLYLTVAEGAAGFRILYLYTASDDDGIDESPVPSIDAGCFISSVVERPPLADVEAGWANMKTFLLDELFFNASAMIR